MSRVSWSNKTMMEMSPLIASANDVVQSLRVDAYEQTLVTTIVS